MIPLFSYPTRYEMKSVWIRHPKRQFKLHKNKSKTDKKQRSKYLWCKQKTRAPPLKNWTVNCRQFCWRCHIHIAKSRVHERKKSLVFCRPTNKRNHPTGSLNSMNTAFRHQYQLLHHAIFFPTEEKTTHSPIFNEWIPLWRHVLSRSLEPTRWVSENLINSNSSNVSRKSFSV